MVLVIDVGNSNLLFGLTDLNKINKTFRLITNKSMSLDEYYQLIKNELSNDKFDDVIISSVVPYITNLLDELFKKYYNINSKIITPSTDSGLILKVDEPSTVGADLICDTIGALKYYDEAIIVDLGTATKYIYCKNNTFYGCAISTGVNISLNALVSNTALLPKIKLEAPKNVISTNTIECMKSGIIYGAASEVDGMILRIKEELKNNEIKVVATGGLSKLIVPLCKNKIELMPDLNLDGIIEIYKKITA